MGNDHPSIAPYETLRARNGFIIVAAGNPRLWTQLCIAIGAEHLVDDPRFENNTERLRHRTELKRELETRFQQFTLDELIKRLQAHNVPCGQVRSIADALADPQVAAREMVIAIEHPDLGTINNLGNPVKLSASPAEVRLPPPRLGEHTDEVLKEFGLPSKRR